MKSYKKLGGRVLQWINSLEEETGNGTVCLHPLESIVHALKNKADELGDRFSQCCAAYMQLHIFQECFKMLSVY